jgi:hypothetical protein
MTAPPSSRRNLLLAVVAGAVCVAVANGPPYASNLTGPSGAVVSAGPRSATMPPYPTVDESRQRLLTFGWSVGETGGASTWLVTGTKGEHCIHAEGATQSEAWWRACVQAREVGLLAPAREGDGDG